MAEWITQAEYARRHGTTRQAVWKAAKNGRLKTHGKMVDADCDIRLNRRVDPANSVAVGDEELGIKLQKARLEKLNADTVIQRQKDERTRREWREANMAEFAECFFAAFAPFRSRLIEMRLPAETLDQLGEAWETCWRSFAERLGREAEAGRDESGN